MSDYLTHASPAGHYRISYPADWMHLSVSNTEAFFFSQLQGPDDDFSDHISVRAVDPGRSGGGAALDAIAEEIVAAFRRSEPTLSIDGTRTVEVAGRPAVRLDLRSSGKQNLRYDSVIVLDEPLAYHITYTSEAEHFDAFTEVFQAMLDSFSLDG